MTCTLHIFINTCFNGLQIIKYRTVKNFGRLQIGTQNMFGRENIGGLSIYTEGNQGKTKGWQIRLGELISNHQNLYFIVKDFYHMVLSKIDKSLLVNKVCRSLKQ